MLQKATKSPDRGNGRGKGETESQGNSTPSVAVSTSHVNTRRIVGGTTAHAIYRSGGLADRLRGHCDSCGGSGCYHCGHLGAGGQR